MIRYRVFTKTGDASYLWCIKEVDGSLTFGRDSEITLAKRMYNNEMNYIRDMYTMIDSLKRCYAPYWKEINSKYWR